MATTQPLVELERAACEISLREVPRSEAIVPEATVELQCERAPTLLIVGGNDPEVLDLNRDAYRLLTCAKRLEVVPRATHLFEEAGALERVALLARDWFAEYLGKPATAA